MKANFEYGERIVMMMKKVDNTDTHVKNKEEKYGFRDTTEGKKLS